MNKLTYFRKINNYSQQELANILGVQRATVSMWETGTNQMSEETILKICEIFKISSDELLNIETKNDIPKIDDIFISEKEMKIIRRYRSFNQELKDA
ncbi:MAG: helix-turn-helix transcriptional regulator, partial [Caldisericia bacterium]|nr:helix-turn-helix transcriptional regulator [Caldisericia bacterium]